jgi:hypothetical protein
VKFGGQSNSKRRVVVSIKAVLSLTSRCHSTCEGGVGFSFPDDRVKPSRGSPSCHALQESPFGAGGHRNVNRNQHLGGKREKLETESQTYTRSECRSAL